MNNDIRICFIGDSFVNGTGDETALGWVGRLCASAHARGTFVTYYNLGIRRNTSQDILNRWDSEITLRLPPSCDGRVVLSCGVNDTVIENGLLRVSTEESLKNIRLLLSRAQKYNALLVSPPPVPEKSHNSRVFQLSQAFAREAKFFGIPYIDIFSPLADDFAFKSEALSNDGYHPSSGGYSRIARIISCSPEWWFHET
jgi:lysophospholipase L1-like esterase